VSRASLQSLALLVALVVACNSPDSTLRHEPSGIELVLIPAGRFTMGSSADTSGRESQETLHQVTISRAFYLGRSEVTQRQWQLVMGTNPSHFQGCDECPVETVTFHDIEAFLGRLNRDGGVRFRLPTEAEWEYACKASGDRPFGALDSLGAADANIDGRFPYNAPAAAASKGTLPVARFPPNAWGLSDMSGNVWEWVQDEHCPYPDLAVTDPVGACKSPLRVIRGGSWAFDGNSARCALRYTHRPQDRGYSLGFRIARDR
jgi:formylglycine-generating enzyme required for sulfatase activity